MKTNFPLVFYFLALVAVFVDIQVAQFTMLVGIYTAICAKEGEG